MLKKAGLRLKQLREKRGLTLKELSRVSGVSISVMSKFENGTFQTAPSAMTIFKIAKALEVDFEYFFREQIEEKIILKQRYYINDNELIARTPLFSDMKQLTGFLKAYNNNKVDWQRAFERAFIFLPAYLKVSFCFYMPDDSMAPMIMENDIVCIFITTSLINKVPCLFMNNNRLILRHWEKKNTQTRLYPVNKEYPDISYDNDSKKWQAMGISLCLRRDAKNSKGENTLIKTLDYIRPVSEKVENPPKTY